MVSARDRFLQSRKRSMALRESDPERLHMMRIKTTIDRKKQAEREEKDRKKKEARAKKQAVLQGNTDFTRAINRGTTPKPNDIKKLTNPMLNKIASDTGISANKIQQVQPFFDKKNKVLSVSESRAREHLKGTETSKLYKYLDKKSNDIRATTNKRKALNQAFFQSKVPGLPGRALGKVSTLPIEFVGSTRIQGARAIQGTELAVKNPHALGYTAVIAPAIITKGIIQQAKDDPAQLGFDLFASAVLLGGGVKVASKTGKTTKVTFAKQTQNLASKSRLAMAKTGTQVKSNVGKVQTKWKSAKLQRQKKKYEQMTYEKYVKQQNTLLKKGQRALKEYQKSRATATAQKKLNRAISQIEKQLQDTYRKKIEFDKKMAELDKRYQDKVYSDSVLKSLLKDEKGTASLIPSTRTQLATKQKTPFKLPPVAEQDIPTRPLVDQPGYIKTVKTNQLVPTLDKQINSMQKLGYKKEIPKLETQIKAKAKTKTATTTKTKTKLSAKAKASARARAISKTKTAVVLSTATLTSLARATKAFEQTKVKPVVETKTRTATKPQIKTKLKPVTKIKTAVKTKTRTATKTKAKTKKPVAKASAVPKIKPIVIPRGKTKSKKGKKKIIRASKEYSTHQIKRQIGGLESIF